MQTMTKSKGGKKHKTIESISRTYTIREPALEHARILTKSSLHCIYQSIYSIGIDNITSLKGLIKII